MSVLVTLYYHKLTLEEVIHIFVATKVVFILQILFFFLNHAFVLHQSLTSEVQDLHLPIQMTCAYKHRGYALTNTNDLYLPKEKNDLRLPIQMTCAYQYKWSAPNNTDIIEPINTEELCLPIQRSCAYQYIKHVPPVQRSCDYLCRDN